MASHSVDAQGGSSGEGLAVGPRRWLLAMNARLVACATTPPACAPQPSAATHARNARASESRPEAQPAPVTATEFRRSPDSPHVRAQRQASRHRLHWAFGLLLRSRCHYDGAFRGLSNTARGALLERPSVPIRASGFGEASRSRASVDAVAVSPLQARVQSMLASLRHSQNRAVVACARQEVIKSSDGCVES